MSTTFTLRPTERSPGNSLEGSFRVHLTPKEFKSLSLSNGELIRLFSIATGAKGYAVAWLGAQTNAGNKAIAKVSDLLRERYGLTLHEPILIERATEPLKAIESVEVSYSDSSNEVANYESTEELLCCIRNTLAETDIILPGCTVDVQPKGLKYRQRNAKVRIKIEHVEPIPDETAPLYFDYVKSSITTTNTPLAKKPDASATKIIQMRDDGIGGLSDQINSINKSLGLLTSETFVGMNPYLFGPTAFLVHGPEGSGKTLLLDRLAECDWQAVFRLDPQQCNLKTLNKDVVEVFSKACASQPSLIVMDRLDQLLGKAESLTWQLRSELTKLEGTKVVVAAAARSVYDIDASLRTGSTFKTELEIFPPNAKQREDMLRQILGLDLLVNDIDYHGLAERTHGFVGRDIRRLCEFARNRRVWDMFDGLKEEQVSPRSDKDSGQHNFVTQQDLDSVMDLVRPTVLKDSILEVPKVRWTDIAGLDHVREVLEAIMIRPYRFPDLYTKFGNPPSRKGVLLYGPPGNAKTLIAQAVATESNQNFLAVKGSELIKMYVGESERAIRDVFRRARAARPCIIFFDEIDSIGKSREKSQDSGLNVVTTLLNEMDGIEALKEVFIIGATNRPDILDSALIRPGRFDSHIHIGLPNNEARKQILEIHTRKQSLAEDVDLGILASRTDGSSGADIKGLCVVAVEMAMKDFTEHPESTAEVKMCHFERALDQHVPHTDAKEAARYEGWRPGKSLSADSFD